MTTLDRYLPSDARARVERPTGEAAGLPREVYVSPDFFALERDLLLARNWVCVGLVQDLPKPGDQKPTEISGMPILLVRGRDMKIRAFHNVCSHRGVQLVTKQIKGRPTVVCPYHSWTYALDGKLVATPKFCGEHDSHAGFDPSQHGLKEIRCESWHSLLFVNIAANAPPLAEYVKPLVERWADYDLSLLRHGASLGFEIKANWKLVIENFVERYHLPSVHPTLNSYSSVDATFQIAEDGLPFVGVGSRNYAPKPVDGQTLPHFPGVPPERAKMAEYVALFPNVMLGCLYDHFYAFIIQPMSVDFTLERFEFFYVGDEAMGPELAAARQDCADRRKIINSEDIDIVQRLHTGRFSPAMTGGVFSPVLEDTTHGFQKMVQRALVAGAASVA